MEGRSIIDVILENKDKIKYCREIYEETGSYWMFKFYFNKRNIFGFRKYLRIFMYSDPAMYEPIKELVDIDIEIPSWNILKICEYVELNRIDAEKLGKELQKIYYKYVYNDKYKTWKHIGEILSKNLEEKK